MLSSLWWLLYGLATATLVAYGAHSVRLLWFARRRGPAYLARLAELREVSASGRTDFPEVLVQLPIYEEPRVVERLVRAVAALDWPRERLRVQLLDDSADRAPGAAAVEIARDQGLSIDHVARPDRRGFKAGALAHGLTLCDAEFVAVFDADFVPATDFLRRALPLFDGGSDVACVQGRWEHLNAEQSFLTRAQSVGVDTHFWVQHLGRAAGAGLLHFNGSAGVWRRRAIEDAGGWSCRTLTEDLDLSFRAQLRGWRILFDPDLAVPAELPPTLSAYKSQQRRWATGSVQCARLLLGPLWNSSLPVGAKFEGTFHLLGYGVCVAMVALLLLLPLGVGHVVALGTTTGLWPLWVAVWLAALCPLSAAIWALERAGRRRPKWGGHVGSALRASLLGLGTSANNAIAALRGTVVRGGEFVRTPKQGAGRRVGGSLPRLEFLLALGTALGVVLLAWRSPLGLLPYALFCASGYWSLLAHWWRVERPLEGTP